MAMLGAKMGGPYRTPSSMCDRCPEPETGEQPTAGGWLSLDSRALAPGQGQALPMAVSTRPLSVTELSQIRGRNA